MYQLQIGDQSSVFLNEVTSTELLQVTGHIILHLKYRWMAFSTTKRVSTDSSVQTHGLWTGSQMLYQWNFSGYEISNIIKHQNDKR